MKSQTFLFLILIFLFSCNQSVHSPIENSIKETLNKKVNLNVFESIYFNDSVVNIEELRKKVDYISIVYLRDGCAPCYPKYIAWHQKMDSIGSNEKHTVLFIIEGNSKSTYGSFKNAVLKHGHFDNKYYTAIDNDFSFLDGNPDIPSDLIENSLLINHENKVKLIGAPFINTEMKNLFHRIISE
jgi:hypothetical protein